MTTTKDPRKGIHPISDSEIDGESLRVRSPDFIDRDRSDFTPITNLSDMGPALSEIRGTVRDIKPKVDKLVEASVKHEVQLKASEARILRSENKISDIAERQHSSDCAQVETIKDLKEESHRLRQSSADVTQRVITTETKVSALGTTVTETQNDTKVGRRWLIGIVVSIVIIIGGAALGWVITLVMVRSDVAYLTREQQEMQEHLTSIQSATSQSGSRVEAVVKRIESAQMSPEPEKQPPAMALEDVWCTLSDRERERLRKSIPSDKVPTRRCP